MMKVLAAALLAFCQLATCAVAQTAPKIFVASTGSDASDGGRNTPKRSFQAAHDAVAAGGEIVALDTSGYGPVTITKSVSIVVPAGVSGFVTTSGSNGITVAAGSDDVVTLRGLIIEGPSQNGYGVYATKVGLLVVEDTTIRNFHDGIFLTGTANAQLVVRGGAIRNSTYGISLLATGSGNMTSHVTGTELTLDETSFLASGAGSGSVYFFATRCGISDSAFPLYSSGIATIITDSCSIVKSGTVYTTVSGGTAYARNNSIVKYTSLGSLTGTFSGQVQ